MAGNDGKSGEARGPEEQRREKRLAVESLVLPFLGSRESDHQSFQYLIEDVSVHGARISLPNWVISRERLHMGETINLHLPFRVSSEVIDQGRVMWSRWDNQQQTQVCGLQLHKAPPPHGQTVCFDLSDNSAHLDLQHFASQEGLAASILKDSYLLKKGVSIYLAHLIPYFSRVGDYPRQDFKALKEAFLLGLQQRVLSRQERLAELYAQLNSGGNGADDKLALLDLEELRELSESEISQDVLGATFTSPMAMQQIAAIKNLEKRLHTNYNSLMMLYLRSVAGA